MKAVNNYNWFQYITSLHSKFDTVLRDTCAMHEMGSDLRFYKRACTVHTCCKHSIICDIVLTKAKK